MGVFNKRKLKRINGGYHYAGIDGEATPESPGNRFNFRLFFGGVILGLMVMFTVTWVFNYLLLVTQNRDAYGNRPAIDYLSPEMFAPITGEWQSHGILMGILFVGTIVFMYSKFNNGRDEIMAHGQHGDNRWATIDEIRQQYKEVPNMIPKVKDTYDPKKDYTYTGLGGIPISHFKGNYYVCNVFVNSLILGTSRSGKGETTVFPQIDILSRGEEQPSMVVNDPKGELYRGSKSALEKRGYRVFVLNVQKPLKSMSFNPLQLAIDAWTLGDKEEAAKRLNTFISTLFAQGAAGDNAFFYDGAKAAINALALVLMEKYLPNEPDKVTMYNVNKMLMELGSKNWKDADGVEKNALDEYMENLPASHPAKDEYGQTSFAGGNTRGSILSTAKSGLAIFSNELFGKLTSENSVDMRDVGFPKNLKFRLPDTLDDDGKVIFSYEAKTVTITFKPGPKSKNKRKPKEFHAEVERFGIVALDYKCDLESGDLLEISCKEDSFRQARFKITLPDENSVYDTKATLTPLDANEPGGEASEVPMPLLFSGVPILKYSDKPVAVFMIIPDYDPSNHILATIYVNQLYTELAAACGEEGKCHRPVDFIFDEFGNMPAIDNLDGILTVCLGRQMRFNLYVQSYSQIESRYPGGYKAIKENCQNHIYIMSGDSDTHKAISEAVGNNTVISTNLSGKHVDSDPNYSRSGTGQPLILKERLATLIEGETVVIRIHRQDKDRQKIRSYPIFNTKATNMPFRWQHMEKDPNYEFNPANSAFDIKVECGHRNLNLMERMPAIVDFMEAAPLSIRIKYCMVNQLALKQETWDELQQALLNAKMKKKDFPFKDCGASSIGDFDLIKPQEEKTGQVDERLEELVQQVRYRILNIDKGIGYHPMPEEHERSLKEELFESPWSKDFTTASFQLTTKNQGAYYEAIEKSLEKLSGINFPPPIPNNLLLLKEEIEKARCGSEKPPIAKGPESSNSIDLQAMVDEKAS